MCFSMGLWGIDCIHPKLILKRIPLVQQQILGSGSGNSNCRFLRDVHVFPRVTFLEAAVPATVDT